MTGRKQQFTSFLYGASFRRIAFYILIFFLAMMTLWDVTSLTLEYFGNPKQANMNVKFNQSVTYPNMTFCMPRRQAWSHFGVNVGDKTSMDKVEQWGPNIEKELVNLTDRETFMHGLWPPELVMSAYQAIATLNALERESVAQQAVKDINRFAKSGKKKRARILVKNWLDAIRDRNVTFAEFTNRVGLEVLRRSMKSFQRWSYNDSDVFHMKTAISWLSNTHLCFRPVFQDEESFKNIEDQGIFFIMVVTQDVKMFSEKSNAECISVDFHGRPTTTVRNMEGKGRVKDGISEELCAGQMHELSIEIRANYKMLENDESATACRLYDDEESKSEFDCRLRCRMKMIREMCRCTPQTLQYLSDDKSVEEFPLCDYEKCNVSENQNFTDQTCAQSCVPHCVQMRYSLSHNQQRAKNPVITSIKLIWGAFEYLELEQTYVWSLWTFTAAIGGSIGMWLGLSMLSLIQLIIFLTDRTAHKVTVVKKKKDPASAGHEPPPHYESNPAQFGSANSNPTQMRGQRLLENGERKGSASMNPFGGPVAVNIFESPFQQKGKTSQGSAMTAPTAMPRN
uniref:Amiloride-sensitive sodium channel n=1 Tax=Globodera rostochiensis TaxID=31243 RepID=A0A914HZ17_GLORO